MHLIQFLGMTSHQVMEVKTLTKLINGFLNTRVVVGTPQAARTIFDMLICVADEWDSVCEKDFSFVHRGYFCLLFHNHQQRPFLPI